MKKSSGFLAVMILLACIAVLGNRVAYAKDIWVFTSPGEDRGAHAGIAYDYYIDTDVLNWRSDSEFYIENKIVYTTGEYVGMTSYCFYRPKGEPWYVAYGRAYPLEDNHYQVAGDALAEAILEGCLCEKARSNSYKQNRNDEYFQFLQTWMKEMGGTWYDEDGYAVRIDGEDMSLNGYKILEVYDFAGGNPGAAKIVIRQPNGCRVAKISWVAHTGESMTPYFEIDGVEYSRYVKQ